MRLLIAARCATHLVAVASLVASTATAAPPVVEPLGDLPGGAVVSFGLGVARDGSALVGAVTGPGGQAEAARYRDVDGWQVLGPTPIALATSSAIAISDDGQSCAGTFYAWQQRQAFRWTTAGGYQALGALPGGQGLSNAEAISADGAIVVGSAHSPGGSRAFRWDAANGMVSLGTPAGRTSSQVSDVSADGGIIVGWSYDSDGSLAWRWTAASGFEALASPPPTFREAPNARAVSVSAGGDFVAGNGTAFGESAALRWTQWSGPQRLLGPGADDAAVLDISDNGRVVVGRSQNEAFIWDATHGIRNLSDTLVADYGSDLSGWFQLWSAEAVSADGRTIVGTGARTGGAGQMAWRVTLPAQCSDGLDNDGDGFADGADSDCANATDNIEASDTDADWFLDSEDNCPLVANPDQADADDDTIGDACESATPILRVPSEYSTIQAAIDASAHGDRVLVAPGIYRELLDLLGKRITLESEEGATATVIDGGGQGPIITIASGETRGTIVRGFTLRGGASTRRASGIFVQLSGATIEDNIIEGCTNRASITAHFADVLIRRNELRGGSHGSLCEGIYVLGRPSLVEIVDNEIYDHRAFYGAGIYVLGGGSVRIVGNRIHHNEATVRGAGIYSLGADTPVEIVQNLIHNNRSSAGAGIALAGEHHVVQNSIVWNSRPFIYTVSVLVSSSTPSLFTNNLIVTTDDPFGRSGVLCEDDPGVVIARNNLVWAPGAPAWDACVDPTGIDGNLTLDPLLPFAAEGDARPVPGSPLIDAGDSGAALVPLADFASKPRFLDGDGDGTPMVDIGAFELGPPECSNGLDDDADGWIDFPEDPGCASPASAFEETGCSDGRDGDGDQLVDDADPGCSSASDASERESTLPCDNGIEDEFDLAIDFPADPGCRGPAWPTESPACNDYIDNDGDGLTDIQDPQCLESWMLSESPPQSGCGLGIELIPALFFWHFLRFGFRRRPGHPTAR